MQVWEKRDGLPHGEATDSIGVHADPLTAKPPCMAERFLPGPSDSVMGSGFGGAATGSGGGGGAASAICDAPAPREAPAPPSGEGDEKSEQA